MLAHGALRQNQVINLLSSLRILFYKPQRFFSQSTYYGTAKELACETMQFLLLVEA
jgi:hypothetical protein